MRTEQDAVMGVITVQLGLASAEQVQEARRALGEDGPSDIAAALVRTGAITPADQAMLATISGEALKAHDGDVRSTLASFGGESALMQTYAGSLGFDTSGQLEERTDAELTDEGFVVTVEHPGRYTLGKRQRGDGLGEGAELGRGGIGRVLLAFDEHIGREVALKELLPQAEALGSGDSVLRKSLATVRFLREARVTGQLEHPNIVPVYELGRRKDGTLYYTMKVVRGRTLMDALNDCKGLSNRLELLKHYADLCDAIAYAHSRGVIHRDIKPDNVMVGEFGETVVLDWGLAKSKGKDDLRERDLARSVEGFKEMSAEKTAANSVIGTPLYMSPEQVQGKLDLIDERSDVWSLGITLYELLTGAPPFHASNVLDLLVRVAADPLVPVTERVPEAPPELAAICEKALNKDRAKRYANGQEMAQEMRAYLTGGRVSAHEYTTWHLVKRFAAKNRVALVTASVAIGLLLALGVVSYRGVVSERNRAVDAERTAKAARTASEASEKRAKESRDSAERLVQYMLGDLTDRLEPVGRLDLLDGVVSAVKEYHAESGAVNASNLRQSLSRAKAMVLLGDVQRQRGDLAAAKASYGEALALRKAVVAAASDDLELDLQAKMDLAQSHLKLGHIHTAKGDIKAARAAFQQSVDLRAIAAAKRPDNGDWQLQLSNSYASLGDARASAGDRPGAMALYQQALGIREALAKGEPDNTRWRFEVAEGHDRIGNMHFRTGDHAAAKRAFGLGLGLRRALVAESPENMSWQDKLSVSYDLVGDVQLQQREPKAAEKSYAASLRIVTALAKRDPSNARWQRDLAVTYNRHGDVLAKLNAVDRALGAYEASLAIIAGLSAAHPDNARWKRDLAVGHNRVGDLKFGRGDVADAMKSYEASLALALGLAKLDGDNTTWQHDLAVSRQKVGAVLAARGDVAGARKSYDQALTILRRLLKLDAANSQWKADLAATYEQVSSLKKPGRTYTPAEAVRRQRQLKGKADAKDKRAGKGQQRQIKHRKRSPFTPKSTQRQMKQKKPRVFPRKPKPKPTQTQRQEKIRMPSIKDLKNYR